MGRPCAVPESQSGTRTAIQPAPSRIAEPVGGSRGSFVRVIPGHWMATFSLVGLVALVLLMIRAQLAIDMRGYAFFAFAGFLTVAALGCWHFREPENNAQHIMRGMLEYYGLFVFVCVIGALASYPVAAMSSGFSDPVLVRFDRAMGLNWSNWYALDLRHPLLQQLERAAYQTIYLSPLIVLGAFACQGRKAEARSFIATFGLGALITLIGFRIMPALGPLAYVWRRPIPVMPASALWQAELIPMLRTHAMRTVELGSLRGLVGVPSFHTASALFYMLFGWRIREVRWLIVAINLAMLLATPVEGNHYFVDMVGGAVVAIIAYAVVRIWASGDLAPAAHPAPGPDIDDADSGTSGLAV